MSKQPEKGRATIDSYRQEHRKPNHRIVTVIKVDGGYLKEDGTVTTDKYAAMPFEGTNAVGRAKKFARDHGYATQSAARSDSRAKK